MLAIAALATWRMIHVTMFDSTGAESIRRMEQGLTDTNDREM